MKQKERENQRNFFRSKKDPQVRKSTNSHSELRHSKHREDGSTNIMLGGRKPVIEMLKTIPDRVLGIYLRSGLEMSQELSESLKLFSEKQSVGNEIKITTLENKEFEEVVPFADSQGIAILVSPAPEIELKELIVLSKAHAGVLLLIDQVLDPQNFGAILRSAEALGADGVVATTRHTAPSSIAMRKASMGASELLPTCRINSLHGAIKQLRSAGFWIVGTELGEDVKLISDVDFDFPLAIIVGSESSGLRRLTREDCDYCVRIPLRGRMQSLNVAQATSVLLYEVMKKNSLYSLC